MANILLTGHGGSANRGCQAILVTTIALAREHIPGCRLALISWDPEADLRAAADVLEGVMVRRRRPQRASIPADWSTSTRFRPMKPAAPSTSGCTGRPSGGEEGGSP